MLEPRIVWGRRAFLKSMFAFGAMNAFASTARPSSIAEPRFAYVGSSGNGGIRIFSVKDGSWKLVQSVASNSPSFLAIHPSQRFLYAANELIEHEGLPRGTVEAYLIDPGNGRLTLLNRQPLSLSATGPRHFAIAPDGRHLVVTTYGGGAYNVLPIELDGRLGRVSGIVKEAGCGFHPEYQSAAHPHSVAFDATGRYVLSTDLGCDRLSVFTIHSGKLIRSSRISIPSGKGPGHLAFHPSGSLLYGWNELDASVSCYRFEPATGELLREANEVQVFSGRTDGRISHGFVAVDPSGRFLYTVADNVIAGWEIDRSSGALSKVQSWTGGIGALQMLAMSPDGGSLVTLDRERGVVMRIDIDAADGRFLASNDLAPVEEPLSLALKYY